jgi:hypothetical protein
MLKPERTNETMAMSAHCLPKTKATTIQDSSLSPLVGAEPSDRLCSAERVSTRILDVPVLLVQEDHWASLAI